VSDFGLVGSVGEDAGARAPLAADSATRSLGADLTRTGEVMGTPMYMAPEQHAAGATDARTDQFAFCVALFEALYGVRPFTGQTYREIAYQVSYGEPQPPPAGSAVPAHIHAAVRRGLAKRPDDRFPDMDSLLAALEADPTRARRRRLWAAGGAVLVAAAAAALYLAWPRDDARARCRRAGQELARMWDGERREALAAAIAASGVAEPDAVSARLAEVLDQRVAALAAMRRDACEATYVRGEQSGELLDRRARCLDGLAGQLGALIARLSVGRDPNGYRDAAAAAVDLTPVDRCADLEALADQAPLPADPAVRARVGELLAELGRADALLALGEFADSRAIVDRVAAEAESTGCALLVGRAAYLAGRLAYTAGDNQGAERALRSAVQRMAEARQPYLETEAWLSLVYVVGHLEERVDEGLALAQAAEAALARVRRDPLYEARMHNNVGLVLLSGEQFEAARERLERALALFVSARGEDHIDVALARNNLGNALNGLERYAEARAQLEQALAVRLAHLAPDHPDVATTLNDLGLAADGEGRHAEAVAHFERALAIRRAALGDGHPRTAAVLNNMGLALAAQGDYARAEASYREALAILERVHGPTHFELAGPLHNLGAALQAAGQSRPAWEAYARALTIAEQTRGPDNVAVTDFVEDLGSMLQELGLRKDALAYFNRSLSIRERVLGAVHAKVADTLAQRGALLREDGDGAAARADFERALAIYSAIRPADDHDRAMAEFNLGLVLEEAGALDDAAGCYRRALAALEVGGVTRREAIGPLRGLGDVARARGAHGEASEHYRRAAEVAEREAPGSALLADTLSELGISLLDQQRPDLACQPLAHALEVREQTDDVPHLALNRFLLAKARWGAGEDRPAAEALARQALAAFREIHARGSVAEVEAWLRGRR
jgi:tetratricopeptide (TPR) repeat protein